MKRWYTLLGPEDVEKLLAAPRPGERFYFRDKAMLEMLCGTGCRLAEIVKLTLDDMHLKRGCTGDGERTVRLERRVVDAIRAYLDEQRDRLVRTTPACPFVFVSRAGRALTREWSGTW
jgi:integrase/recombinase XerD